MQPPRTAESKRLKMGGKINTTNNKSDFLQSIRFLVNKTNLMHNFSFMFISTLYMFRAAMCPSSGEITLSMRHLVFVTLCG